MKQKLEEFMADLICIGFSSDRISEKGYDYAIALLTEQRMSSSAMYVPSELMREAVGLVRDALPGAHRLWYGDNK